MPAYAKRLRRGYHAIAQSATADGGSMKRLFFYAFIFSFSLIGMDVEQAPTKPKPKILILTSGGGHGHTSATNALKEYLGPYYTIKVVNLIDDILGSLDWIKKLGISKNAEQYYNDLLTSNSALLDTITTVGRKALSLQEKEAGIEIKKKMEVEQPNLVISVVPLFNVVTAQVLQQLKIPFWIIPTDFDSSDFVEGLNAITEWGCYFNVPLMGRYIPEEKELIIDIINIVNNNISPFVRRTNIGMPVRKQFLQKYDMVKIKKEQGIPLDKKVVMVMLGGQGSVEMPLIAQELAKVTGKVHYIFSIAAMPKKQDKEAPEAFEKRYKEWEQIFYNPLKKVVDEMHIDATILPGRPDIAQFMACCEFLITKSGGQTISELLYLKIPVVLDARKKAIKWEKLNRSLIVENGYGMEVDDIHKYASVVQQLLDNPSLLQRWKQNMQELSLQNPEQAAPQVVKFILELYQRSEGQSRFKPNAPD
jgi:UDP-N-acetylglucosamine:LPS N-acetylglucosamine transferase